MADEQKILASIEIGGSDELEKIARKITEINKELKAMKDTDSAAAQAKKIQLKEEQAAYRDLQKQTINNRKESEKSIKTLEGMRVKLSNMRREVVKLDVGSKKFVKMQKEIRKLNDEVGEAEQGMGMFNRNVGNYENAISSAFQKMGINIGAVTGSVKGLGTAMSASTHGVSGATKALKIFKIALISTGVGAIVVALGLLIAAFTKTQSGIDRVTKAMLPLKGVFAVIKATLEEISLAFVKLFSGDFKGGLADIRESWSSIGDRIREARIEAQRLYDLQVLMRNIGLAILANEGRINREISEQRKILDDVNKSDKERKEAGDQILALTDALTQMKIQQLDAEIEILRINLKNQEVRQRENQQYQKFLQLQENVATIERQLASETDPVRATQLRNRLAAMKDVLANYEEESEFNTAVLEDQQNLLELINQRDQIEADSNNRSTEARNKINAIDKKAADERLRATEAQRAAEAKAADEALKAAEKLQAERDKLLADYNAKLAEFREAARMEDLTDEERQLAMIDKRYQALIDLALEAGQEISEIEEMRAKEKNDLIYDVEKTALEKRKALAKEEADFKKQMDDQILAAKFDALSAGLDLVGSFAKKGSAIEKAAAVLSASVNTYKAANNALSSSYPWPLPQVFAGIAIAQGLANVAKIVRTPEPKGFAGGVIGIDGPGTRTSDQIPAYLSRGEAVMTADAVDAFAPQLGAMERAVGNQPNYQLGNRRFAKGFIPDQPENTWLMQWLKNNRPSEYLMISRQQEIDQLAAKINDKKVFVYEQDISRTQRDVQRIKVAGDL